MKTVVDARGLACPQPVILTRNALQEYDVVTTIVDSESSRQNVTRMAEKSGAMVRVEQRGDGLYLHITRGEAAPVPSPEDELCALPTEGALVLVVPADQMGRGDAELGDILIRAFFHTLGEVQPLPRTIIFLNSGVKLVAEGSPVLDDLQALVRSGVEILACGTCLDYFGLKDRVVVGIVSNMYTIAETMLGAAKVVSL
ncbi:MAG: sulfurtransferase-like selenium metabolism protein YedF [Anaerolineae bacterium]|nr:sulfurtransferase-like selenium metabolism protein YedF [Anaerolineae bacterium]